MSSRSYLQGRGYSASYEERVSQTYYIGLSVILVTQAWDEHPFSQAAWQVRSFLSRSLAEQQIDSARGK